MQTKILSHQQQPLLLIADDEPGNIHIMVEALINDYRIKVATHGKMALDIANMKDQPDLIILDIMMPEMDGFEVCKSLKKNPSTQNIPVMFVTANYNASAELEALKIEAIEFICKPVNPSTLRMRVRNLVKLKQQHDQLMALSNHDFLTELSNRRYFDEFLESEWRRALRDRKPLSLIMFDIDHFKPFNDHYGHIKGDQCLKQVAQAINSLMQRPGDLAARYGGEEFVAILASTDLAESTSIAKACREKIESLKIPHAASPFRMVTVSCGVYGTVPSDMASQSVLIEMADQKLYKAKAGGRNRVES